MTYLFSGQKTFTFQLLKVVSQCEVEHSYVDKFVMDRVRANEPMWGIIKCVLTDDIEHQGFDGGRGAVEVDPAPVHAAVHGLHVVQDQTGGVLIAPEECAPA